MKFATSSARPASLLERYNIVTSPIYMEFLRGERELMCTAWGNPTYNPRGWKGPCYLMTDAHHDTFKEFIDNTPWEKVRSWPRSALRRLHGPCRL